MLLGGQQALNKAEASIRETLAVSIFLQSALSDAEAQQWGDSLRPLDSEILAVRYISKEQAFQDAQNDPGLARSVMLLRDNPFPPAYVLRYSDRAWAERTDPATLLRTLPHVQDIRWDAEARSVFLSLREWRIWLSRFTLGAGGVFCAWALFGLHRFWRMGSSLRDFFARIALGLGAGACAMGIWVLTLRYVGSEATAYRPQGVPWLALWAATLAAVASFGWEKADDR